MNSLKIANVTQNFASIKFGIFKMFLVAETSLDNANVGGETP
mgnify:CR=1 FL=1